MPYTPLTAAELSRTLGLKRCGDSYHGNCGTCGYVNGLSARQKGDTLLLKCFGAGCTFEEIIKSIRTPAAPAVVRLGQRSSCGSSLRQLRHFPTSETVKAIWSESIPIHNTLAETYLGRRGITTSLPQTLRFNPRLWHGPSKKSLSALVACIQDINGHIKSVHRTFLSPDGSKANVTPNKMVKGPFGGCAIRLGVPEGTLAVAEGVETALSVQQQSGYPTWACISAGGMMAVEIPLTVQTLLIFADNDENRVGETAANTLVQRYSRMGKTVKVILPPEVGLDWNDVLMNGGIVA